MRAPGSSRVSRTKPGTRRVWSAPMSRIASHTDSGRAVVTSCLRMEAMAHRVYATDATPTLPPILDRAFPDGDDVHRARPASGGPRRCRLAARVRLRTEPATPGLPRLLRTQQRRL